ncbi:di-heme enzyme [Myxococcota bacterium]|nr:di-heme enzyme [Myxococcota bacterium]
MTLRARWAAFGLVSLAGMGCKGEAPAEDSGAAEGWSWALPEGFPEPWVPEDNPMTEAKVALGRALFYDRRLSLNETMSCGDCHLQRLAFTDGLPTAVGSTGEAHRRASMPLVNVVYASALTWASSETRRLEDQALVPIFGEDPVELGFGGQEDELLRRQTDDAARAAMFEAAFPGEGVTLSGLTRALAAFQRAIVSADSPYDRFINKTDLGALSDDARAGMSLFFSGQMSCSRCHGGYLLSDAAIDAETPLATPTFHNNGLYNLDGYGAYPEGDQGLIEETGDYADMGRFRAPSLRNVAVTAPYMHDGHLATLDDVIDHYARGGEGGPYQSPLVTGFVISDDERRQLRAFLESLTDETLLTDPRFAPPE